MLYFHILIFIILHSNKDFQYKYKKCVYCYDAQNMRKIIAVMVNQPKLLVCLTFCHLTDIIIPYQAV